MHSKFNTTYSYMTMNVLFSQDSSYVLVKSSDVNERFMMDLVEFFDFGFVDPSLSAAALRMSASNLVFEYVEGDDDDDEDVPKDNELTRLLCK